ncbi:hypothetical protein F7734_60120 [Scytonema sp. UIC 10036]|nr:hypothetical protein [Scytonema sp. UIC 10036]MUH01834.1 hypothetical protein [Scytonema sp. UIC 10036]
MTEDAKREVLFLKISECCPCHYICGRAGKLSGVRRNGKPLGSMCEITEEGQKEVFTAVTGTFPPPLMQPAQEDFRCH